MKPELKPWQKMLINILAIVLASVVGLSQVSCLTPEQLTALNNLTVQVNADKDTLAKLYADYQANKADLKAIYDKIKAGVMPEAEGLVLVKKIIGNLDAIEGRINEVKTGISSTEKAIAAAKAAGVPWQYWLIPIGSAALGIASMFVPALSPLAAAVSGATQKLKTQQEISGSLSRTLDTVVKDTPNLQPLVANLMHQEQAADELAVKTDYDQLRADAQAGRV